MFVQGVATEVALEQGVDNCGFYLDWTNINFENSLAAPNENPKIITKCLDNLQQDQRCQ